MARRGDEDAPWLAEAEPGPRTEVSRKSFYWGVIIFLVLLAAAVIGGIFAFSRQDAGSTTGYMEASQAPLILAEPGPYKVLPTDPKGLDIKGQDQTLYAAGAGIDEGSNIDTGAVPEVPLPRPGTAASGPPQDLLPDAPVSSEAPPPVLQAPVVASKPVVVTPPKPQAPKTVSVAPPKTVAPPKPAGKPGTVQLGAFSSRERAEAVWADLRAKHGLGGFSRAIGELERDGKPLFRLRASGGDAVAACARLKAAGDACTVVE